MYVDPMNTEGFGERDELERALEREIWRVGHLEVAGTCVFSKNC